MNELIPYDSTAKYLGLKLDVKLRWKVHVKKNSGVKLSIRYRKCFGF